MVLGQIGSGTSIFWAFCSASNNNRSRGELQRTFFPPVYSDTQETQRLEPGDQRVWTAMRVFVELRGETSLHIPLRESSKVDPSVFCLPTTINPFFHLVELAMGRANGRS